MEYSYIIECIIVQTILVTMLIRDFKNYLKEEEKFYLNLLIKGVMIFILLTFSNIIFLIEKKSYIKSIIESW